MSSSVYLLPDDLNPLSVVFDTTISETHEQAAEVTKHPVEKGADVTDHVRTMPGPFSCEVFVSNTPIEDSTGRGAVQSVQLQSGQSVQAFTFTEDFDRIKETYDALTTLQSRAAVMSVITSIRTYDNMVLTLVSAPRTESGGSSFNLTFEPLNTVETLTVTAPQPLEPRGTLSKNKGAQSPKPPNSKDTAKGKSLALKALEAVGVDL
jgi:hypothetical protein